MSLSLLRKQLNFYKNCLHFHRIYHLRKFCHTWHKPEGYDTTIKIYNCLTKNKQPLIVKKKNYITFYTCGPTVYESSHIGHACCYVKLDIIQRILKNFFHLKPITVMNITDIDDKIITKNKLTGIPINELTKQFENEFWRDLEILNVYKPDIVLRVRENMHIIKKFISKLVKDGFGYIGTDGSVYFDIGKLQKYGKLRKVVPEDKPESVKKNVMDFALWKRAKEEDVTWESEWGAGRPGWHVECSALASHVFGNEVDIHAGGQDLIFPHHENEEAQSCAHHGCSQWVNYWLHTGHLHLKNSEKMSKSLSNTISIDTLLKKTTSNVFRMACLMSHYRSDMEFSEEFMTTANHTLNNFVNFCSTCQDYLKGTISVDFDGKMLDELLFNSSRDIMEALRDDFNTPQVVKILNEILGTFNRHSSKSEFPNNNRHFVPVIGLMNLVLDTLEKMGIDVFAKGITTVNDFSEIMNILIEFRQNIRQLGIENKNKDLLTLCDEVRSDLKTSCGVSLKDHGKISSWTKIT